MANGITISQTLKTMDRLMNEFTSKLEEMHEVDFHSLRVNSVIADDGRLVLTGNASYQSVTLTEILDIAEDLEWISGRHQSNVGLTIQGTTCFDDDDGLMVENANVKYELHSLKPVGNLSDMVSRSPPPSYDHDEDDYDYGATSYEGTCLVVRKQSLATHMGNIFDIIFDIIHDTCEECPGIELDIKAGQVESLMPKEWNTMTFDEDDDCSEVDLEGKPLPSCWIGALVAIGMCSLIGGSALAALVHLL